MARSGMKAPDDVECVADAEWRRTPGAAGYGLIYCATQPLPAKPDGLKAMITFI